MMVVAELVDPEAPDGDDQGDALISVDLLDLRVDDGIALLGVVGAGLSHFP
jgi:hypothetical protein